MSKIKIGLFIGLASLTSGIFLLNNNSESEVLNSSVNSKKKSQTVIKNIDLVKTHEKKAVQILKENTSTETVKNTKEEKNYIFRTRNSTGKFLLGILTDEEVITPLIRTSYSYFQLPGTIEDKDGISKFSLSIREDYKNHLNEMYFELQDVTTKKDLTCRVDFLPELEESKIYNIKFDYFDGSLNCFLLSSQDKPQFIIDRNKTLPDKIYVKDLPKELREKFEAKK